MDNGREDPRLDRVVSVKNRAGAVVFTGTEREWRTWATQRREAEALQKLKPKVPARHRMRRI